MNGEEHNSYTSLKIKMGNLEGNMASKKFLAILILVVVTFLTTHAYSNDYTFRNTKWGMSKQDVITSETLKPAEKHPNMIMYKSKLMGDNVFIIYIFVDDKVVRSKYILAEQHSNKNDYIRHYEKYKEALIKKYGKPNEDETWWRNELYKDDPSHWGMAVSMGHLIYFSKWETPETIIFAMLNGDNFEISCGIEYTSKKYEHLEKEQKDKKTMDAL
jgi:hypothetical protein